jgi:hypothetical protein
MGLREFIGTLLQFSTQNNLSILQNFLINLKIIIKSFVEVITFCEKQLIRMAVLLSVLLNHIIKKLKQKL